MNLETFLEELRATCKNYRWAVDKRGNLRGTTSSLPHACVCPIIAMGLEKGLASSFYLSAVGVGKRLGLDDALTYGIMHAADTPDCQYLAPQYLAPSLSLRRQLLDAVASNLTTPYGT